MGIFDLFRRAAPIVTREALMDFLDRQSAFLAQKGIFEYSRARAGPYGNILFDDKEFQAELEKSRWLAFPAMLGMVGEAVEGVLRPGAGDCRPVLLQNLTAAALAAFDRYPVPPQLTAQAWADLRHGVEQDFALLSFHPVKQAMDIPARFIDRYVAAMPIHEKLLAKDIPTIHNYLKSNLCNVHDVFVRRANVAVLVEVLTHPY